MMLGTVRPTRHGVSANAGETKPANLFSVSNRGNFPRRKDDGKPEK